jgi:hypothetical protein
MITHIIQYIDTNDDLDVTNYDDIYNMFFPRKNSGKCIVDIMVVTKTRALFIHIKPYHYSITEINNAHFYKGNIFDKFIQLVKSTQKSFRVPFECTCILGGVHHSSEVAFSFASMRQSILKHNVKIDALVLDVYFTTTLNFIYTFCSACKYIVASSGFSRCDICSMLDKNEHLLKKLYSISEECLDRREVECNTVPYIGVIIDCFRFRKLIEVIDFEELQNLLLLQKENEIEYIDLYSILNSMKEREILIEHYNRSNIFLKNRISIKENFNTSIVVFRNNSNSKLILKEISN